MYKLAREIARFRCRDREPHFWEMCSENLLTRLLPLGLDGALTRIRAMKGEPLGHQQEMDFLPLDSPRIVVIVVLSEAEVALSAHIERMSMPRPTYP